MDAETIKGITGLLTGGGSAAALFLVWIAFNTMQKLGRAMEDLQEIRKFVAASSPAIVEAEKNLREIAGAVKEVDNRLSRQELQLAAALHRPFTKGAPAS